MENKVVRFCVLNFISVNFMFFLQQERPSQFNFDFEAKMNFHQVVAEPSMLN